MAYGKAYKQFLAGDLVKLYRAVVAYENYTDYIICVDIFGKKNRDSVAVRSRARLCAKGYAESSAYVTVLKELQYIFR